MSRSKASNVTCYYCERSFVDEKTLIGHQQLKHFQCSECGKRLQSGPGIFCHMKVHKKELTSIPNALPGRDDPTLRIFGSQGVPEPESSVPVATTPSSSSSSTLIGPPPPISDLSIIPNPLASAQHLFVFQGSSSFSSSSSSTSSSSSSAYPYLSYSTSPAPFPTHPLPAALPPPTQQLADATTSDASRKRQRPASGSKLPTRLVYQDEDTCMEEKRGLLAKYQAQIQLRHQHQGVDST